MPSWNQGDLKQCGMHSLHTPHQAGAAKDPEARQRERGGSCGMRILDNEATEANVVQKVTEVMGARWNWSCKRSSGGGRTVTRLRAEGAV